jgi:hypothetical protein
MIGYFPGDKTGSADVLRGPWCIKYGVAILDLSNGACIEELATRRRWNRQAGPSFAQKLRRAGSLPYRLGALSGHSNDPFIDGRRVKIPSRGQV